MMSQLLSIPMNAIKVAEGILRHLSSMQIRCQRLLMPQKCTSCGCGSQGAGMQGMPHGIVGDIAACIRIKPERYTNRPALDEAEVEHAS